MLTIEVEEGRVQEALHQTARQVSRRLKIPGFRPGKAPYHIVARMVGQEALYDEAIQQLAPKVYEEALTESGVEPFAKAQIEVLQRAPLILKAIVPLRPVVELGNYRQIRIAPEEVTVAEEDVDALLAQLQRENAQVVPVDRPTRMGDEIILDLKGTLDGQTVIEAQRETLAMVEEGTDWPPGLVEELVGMAVGQGEEFTLFYPEDYPSEDLAGHEVTFQATVHEVKERCLPEIDDELAKTVGDFETLEELRERIRHNLQARAELEARERLADRVLAAAIEGAKIEYPPILLERESEAMLAEYAARVEQQGFTFEGYLEAQQKSRDDLMNELRPQAEERLKRALLLGKVTEVEGIEVEAAEIDEEIERIAKLYGDEAAKSRPSIENRLLAQKALQRLVEIATESPINKRR